ncbi:MAG: hypothetical protein ACOX2O_07375 [Bdellovibrionota bacterium]|jgi:hypothetical protein
MNRRGKKVLNLLLLMGVFAISFFGPLFLLKTVISSQTPQTVDPELEGSFKSARRIPGNVGRLKIVNSADLNPVKGEDFLIVGWFKLNKLPLDGERMILLNKYDRGKSDIPGYALAIERQGSDIIPFVYVNELSRKGRWYRFSEAKIIQHVWFMMALTFQDNRFIGLHSASLHVLPSDRIQLLGGYDLKREVIPESSADLFLGGQGKFAFRGFIGPFGIFSGSDLVDDYLRVYAKFVKNPDRIPKELKSAVKFWTIDGEHDLSSAARLIKRSAGKRRKKSS